MNSVQYPGSPRPVYPARPPGAMHSGHPINYITIHAQLYFAHPHPQVFRHIYLALLAFPPPLLLPFPPTPPFLRTRPSSPGTAGCGEGGRLRRPDIIYSNLLYLSRCCLHCSAPPDTPICTAYFFTRVQRTFATHLSLPPPIPRPRNLSYSISRALFVCHPVLILQSTSRLIRFRTNQWWDVCF